MVDCWREEIRLERKAEIRKKAERRPKIEIQISKCQLPPFGFRVLDRFRPSALSLRISLTCGKAFAFPILSSARLTEFIKGTDADEGLHFFGQRLDAKIEIGQ